MKTIAQQLNVKDFPFVIKDKNANYIYYENSNGHGYRQEFDKDSNRTYYESLDGDSGGFWTKREYDKNGNEIYFENSDGTIIDRKPKELTLKEIADKIGIDVKNLKIKD